MLYYREDLPCFILNDPCLSLTDALWCRLLLHNGDSVLIGVIYRPPSSLLENDISLISSVKQALSKRYSHVLIVGDFNVPSLFSNPIPCDLFSHELQDILFTHPLYNHTTNPTRYRFPSNPSLLDLLLTNEELMIEEATYCPPLGRSDHVLLDFRFMCYTSLPMILNRRFVQSTTIRN